MYHGFKKNDPLAFDGFKIHHNFICFYTRNTAAHPNKLELTDMMVISFIDTLITNIILKINDLKN